MDENKKKKSRFDPMDAIIIAFGIITAGYITTGTVVTAKKHYWKPQTTEEVFQPDTTIQEKLKSIKKFDSVEKQNDEKIYNK